MASVILGSIGYAIGGPMGYTIGSMIGSLMFPPDLPTAQVGVRIGDLQVKSSAFGNPIPINFGTNRVGGQYIWSPGIKETKRHRDIEVGKSEQRIEWYNYSLSALVGFCTGPAQAISKLWANGKLIYDSSALNTKVLTENPELKEKGYNIRFYLGTETQKPDPMPKRIEGNTYPAHRGMVYIAIEDFPLSSFNNAAPEFSAEIMDFADTSNFPRNEALATVNTLPIKTYWEPVNAELGALYDPVLDKYYEVTIYGKVPKQVSLAGLIDTYYITEPGSTEVSIYSIEDVFPIPGAARVFVAKIGEGSPTPNITYRILKITNASNLITPVAFSSEIGSKGFAITSGALDSLIFDPADSDTYKENLFNTTYATKVIGDSAGGYKSLLFKYSVDSPEKYSVSIIRFATNDRVLAIDDSYNLTFDALRKPYLMNNFQLDFSLVSTDTYWNFPGLQAYQYPGVFVTHYGNYTDVSPKALVAEGMELPEYLYLVFIATKELNYKFNKLHSAGAPSDDSVLGRYVLKLQIQFDQGDSYLYDKLNTTYKVVDYWFRDESDTAHDALLPTERDYLTGTPDYGVPVIDVIYGEEFLLIHDKMLKLDEDHKLTVWKNRDLTVFPDYNGTSNTLYYPGYNFAVSNNYGIHFSYKYETIKMLLSDILKEIILMVDPLAEFDISDLVDVNVAGFAIPTVAQAAQALSVICDAFGVMIIESDNKYKFVSKDSGSLVFKEVIELGALLNG